MGVATMRGRRDAGTQVTIVVLNPNRSILAPEPGLAVKFTPGRASAIFETLFRFRY